MKTLAEYCEEFLRYENGELYWKKSPSPRVVIGARATRIRKDGYRDVKIMRRRYLAHRIIWLMHYGEMPKNTIDHIDRVRHNNSIGNLRDVPLSVNLSNSGKGYYWCKRERKYLVYKRVDGKRRYFGRYDTEEEARSVACEG